MDPSCLGDFFEGERSAIQAVIGAVHYTAPASRLKLTEFGDSQSHIIQDAVIKVQQRITANSAQGRQVYRRMYQGFLFFVTRFLTPHSQIDEEMLMRQRNAEVLWFNSTKHGHDFALHRSAPT